MRYRRFGRTGWQVSEIGYGMWGMVAWSGSNDEESMTSLQRAADLGCTFFDTAFAYGNGRSEGLLGKLVKANPDKKLYTATKVPPKDQRWPAAADANRTGDAMIHKAATRLFISDSPLKKFPRIPAARQRPPLQSPRILRLWK